jgi:hypothetical protein
LFVDEDAEVLELARRLMAVAEAIDQARSLGLPVAIPPELQRACQAIVSRGGDETGPGTPLTVGGPALQDVPLRKILFQVITPGERFTVQEVAERLSAIGVSAPTNKISNALGSWVRSGRLVREKKGQYSCPMVNARAASKDSPKSSWTSDKQDEVYLGKKVV